MYTLELQYVHYRLDSVNQKQLTQWIHFPVELPKMWFLEREQCVLLEAAAEEGQQKPPHHLLLELVCKEDQSSYNCTDFP